MTSHAHTHAHTPTPACKLHLRRITATSSLTPTPAPAPTYLLRLPRAGQFREALGAYYERMHTCLIACCQRKNVEVKRDAFKALEAFLREVSAHIVELHDDDETEQAEEIFKFMFDEFVRMMRDSSASASRKVSIAIRGFGYLAPPCRMLMTDKDLDQMFNFIAQSCEKIYTVDADESEEAMLHLPSYITSVAKILREMSEIASSYLFVLERLVVILCDHLPKMHSKMRFGAHTALMSMCVGLYPKEEILEEIFGRICYQVLRSACAIDPSLSLEDRYAHADVYVDLFKALLSDRQLAQAEPAFALADQVKLQTIIYGEVVKNILAVVGQLNLKTREEKENGGLSDATATSDLVAGKEPENASDWSVITVLTDFSVRLLKTVNHAHFGHWLPIFVDRIIRLWAQPGYELVGGFYRLLQLCVEIGDDIGYFEHGSVMASAKVDDSGMEAEASRTMGHHNASEHCILKLKQFVKGLHGLFRQFNNDLLASSVCFVLSLPKPFFEDDLGLFVPAVKIALKTGLGNSVLADAALDALEQWIRALAFRDLEPYLPPILELLEAYLISQKAEDTEDTTSSVETKRRKRDRTMRRSKDSWRDLLSGRHLDVKERVVHILGKMGGQGNSLLAASVCLPGLGFYGGRNECGAGTCLPQ